MSKLRERVQTVMNEKNQWDNNIVAIARIYSPQMLPWGYKLIDLSTGQTSDVAIKAIIAGASKGLKVQNIKVKDGQMKLLRDEKPFKPYNAEVSRQLDFPRLQYVDGQVLDLNAKVLGVDTSKYYVFVAKRYKADDGVHRCLCYNMYGEELGEWADPSYDDLLNQCRYGQILICNRKSNVTFYGETTPFAYDTLLKKEIKAGITRDFTYPPIYWH